MPANRFGIDVGQLYRDKENIEGARNRNKMASLQIGEVERVNAERPGKEAAALEHKNMLTDLRGKASQGDTDAARKFLAVGGDPSFIDAVGKMDDAQREQSKLAIDEKGRMLATVRNAPPEKQSALYLQMLSMLPEESKKNMPADFDPNFIDISLSKMFSMEQILDNPQVVSAGNQEQHWKGGRKVDEFDKPIKKGSGGTGSGDLKSGDESLMFRQSAELLGGMFDQAGNLQALDPELRGKAQAIATEATKIFRQGGVTRTQSVTQAAKKFGVETPLQVGQQPGTEYSEGQRAKDANGNVMVYTNGQWTPE